ncbi:MAG TPA: hypothetical protein VG714_09270 [Acidobacteriaceae bacterium]|nr:hypothetical protein [Acidobacteriaceae bacterium]
MAQILFPLFDSTGGPIHRAKRDEWGTKQTEPHPLHHIVLAPVASPRAASLDELLAAAQALDVPAVPAQTAAEALALARQLTPPGGLIIATGSIYLVGELRTLAG